MSNASLILQQAVIAAMEAHPALNATLSGVYDGPPERAAFPYLSVETTQSQDWSTKTELGREIRLAFKLWDDGESTTRLQTLMGHVEDALGGLPRTLPGWRIASSAFIRSLIARDPAGPWSGLIEQRVRMLAS